MSKLVPLIEVPVGAWFHTGAHRGKVVWSINKGSSKAVEVLYEGHTVPMGIAPSLLVTMEEEEQVEQTEEPVNALGAMTAPVAVPVPVVAPAPVAVPVVAPAPVAVPVVAPAPVAVPVAPAPVAVPVVAPAPVAVPVPVAAPVPVRVTVAPVAVPVSAAPVVVRVVPVVATAPVSVPVAPVVQSKPSASVPVPLGRPTVKEFFVQGLRQGLTQEEFFAKAKELYSDKAIGQSLASFKNQYGVYKATLKHLWQK